jgi:hypothetical protein
MSTSQLRGYSPSLRKVYQAQIIAPTPGSDIQSFEIHGETVAITTVPPWIYSILV